MPSPDPRRTTTLQDRFDSRANGLNLVRLAMAVGVLAWHCFPLTGNDLDIWPLRQFVSEVWVDAFFAISGFLIVSSWIRDPHVLRFLRARTLRIMPAFWVCLLVTALLIAPAATGLFGASNVTYVVRNAFLWIGQWDIAGSPMDVAYPGVWNGSLWTLFWEFACYLAVLVLGAVGLVRRKWLFPALFAIAVLALVVTTFGSVDNLWVTRLGRFGLMFIAGAVVLQFADRIPVNARTVGVALVALIASTFLPDYRVVGALPLAYLVLVLGAVITSPRLQLRNDISYGVYIYAFPLQQVLAYAGVTDLLLFAVLSVIVTVPVAAASWFLVEKPALRLKKVSRSRRSRQPAHETSLIQKDA